MCKVRCADCGFLSVRQHETKDLIETIDSVRSSGKSSYDIRVGGLGILAFEDLVCFVRAANLPSERLPHKEDPSPFLAAITKERECSSFVPWKQGYSPKEHNEMQQQSELMKWQADQSREQREWQAAQKKADDERQAASKKADREWQEAQNRATRNRQYIIAAIATISALLGVMITKVFQQPPVINVNPVIAVEERKDAQKKLEDTSAP